MEVRITADAGTDIGADMIISVADTAGDITVAVGSTEAMAADTAMVAADTTATEVTAGAKE